MGRHYHYSCVKQWLISGLINSIIHSLLKAVKVFTSPVNTESTKRLLVDIKL